MPHSLLVGRPESEDLKLVGRGYHRLVRQVGILGLSLLLLLAAWLLVRRQTGALERPLDSAGLLATALLLGMWSTGLRWAWCVSASPSRPRPDWTRHVFGVLTAAGVLLFATALSLPGSPAIALVVFWCVVLGGEAVGGVAFHARRGDSASLPDTAGPGAAGASGSCDAVALAHRLEVAETPRFDDQAAEEDDDELLAADELQRMSRVRDPQGGEVVSGLVRCCFEAGERQRNVHLAFCPPLRKVPHFSLEQVAGPVARIRTSQVETFGVGLEVKLNALSSEPASVQIQFFACEELLDGEAC
jgi:hypothetical protein